MKVTIEGSLTPSTYLPRGVRRVVTLTPFIERLVRRGFVRILPEEPTTEEVAVAATDPAPARNATRDEWAEFLERQGFTVADSATRTELIATWDEASGASTDGDA